MTTTTDPDHLAALVIAIGEALNGAESCLPTEETPLNLDILRSCLSSARAGVSSLAAFLAPTMYPDEEPVATPDFETCGHPETFDPPADNLCASCGGTRQPDGTWVE